MKKIFIILLLSLLLISGFAFWQYQLVKNNLTYKVNKVTANNNGGIDIYVDIYNPTLLPLRIDNFTGIINLDTTPIGTAIIAQPQVIKERATSTIVCTLNVSYKTLLNSLNLINTGTLYFNGTLDFTLLGYSYKGFPVIFDTPVSSLF